MKRRMIFLSIICESVSCIPQKLMNLSNFLRIFTKVKRYFQLLLNNSNLGLNNLSNDKKILIFDSKLKKSGVTIIH